MKGRSQASPWVLLRLVVALACVGLRAAQAGPGAVVSPSALIFPSQLATTTSQPMTASLTNNGDQPLSITGIVLDGTFSQTNTCPTTATLAAGASCTFTVTFMAPNGGPSAQPGFIEITDNASPSLQLINLSGTVADFSLAASPTSATVSAGSSASYTITATASGGFNQEISFTCGALPTGANCNFSPGSITPGASPATGTLSVSTTAASLTVPNSGPKLPAPDTGLWILGVGLFIVGFLAIRRYTRLRPGFQSLVLLTIFTEAVVAMSCGGGSSGSGGGSVATPAGTYTVLITGSPTGGPSSLANPLIVTLVVQ